MHRNWLLGAGNANTGQSECSYSCNTFCEYQGEQWCIHGAGNLVYDVHWLVDVQLYNVPLLLYIWTTIILAQTLTHNWWVQLAYSTIEDSQFVLTDASNYTLIIATMQSINYHCGTNAAADVYVRNFRCVSETKI